MNTYKITFVSNNIESVNKVEGIYFFEGDSSYYINEQGFLVYALIKAETEAEAVKKANEIIKNVIK